MSHQRTHEDHQAQAGPHRPSVGLGGPGACGSEHTGGGHDELHEHAPGCGHETVPHDEHVDYAVHGQLHHPHGGHCDDHGYEDEHGRVSVL